MNLYFTELINFMIISCVMVISCKSQPNMYYGKFHYFNPIEGLFETYLDHFNILDDRKINLRYRHFNFTFNTPNGPILLEISIQPDIKYVKKDTTDDYTAIERHPFYKLAFDLAGHFIVIEHRFYGESYLKTPGMNRSKPIHSKDLKYLTAEQALEDFAHFIEFFKSTHALENRKVAVCGCHYAGTLATWLRYKFPHLVDAVWASSAPMNATLVYQGYYEVIEEMYKRRQRCYKLTSKAYQEFVETKNDTEIQNILAPDQDTKEDHHECKHLFKMNRHDLLQSIRKMITDAYIREDYFRELCEHMESMHQGTRASAHLIGFMMTKWTRYCLPYDYQRFHEKKDLSKANDYVLKYQSCTEFGYSLETTCKFKLFGNNSYSTVDDYLKSCNEEFSNPTFRHFNITKEFLEHNIHRKHLLYGSNNLKVTQVFFIYGENDPWRKSGFDSKSQIPEYEDYHIVKNASFCNDMPFVLHQAVTNNKWLNETVEKGVERMKKWLRTPQRALSNHTI